MSVRPQAPAGDIEKRRLFESRVVVPKNDEDLRIPFTEPVFEFFEASDQKIVNEIQRWSLSNGLGKSEGGQQIPSQEDARRTALLYDLIQLLVSIHLAV